MQTTEDWLQEIAKDYDMNIDKVKRIYEKYGIRKIHVELEKLLILERETDVT